MTVGLSDTFHQKGVFILQQFQDDAFAAIELDQNRHIGIEATNLCHNGIGVLILKSGIERHNPDRLLTGLYKAKDTRMLAHILRISSYDCKPDQSDDDCGKHAPDRHEIANGKGYRENGKVQGEMAKYVEGRPQMGESGGNEETAANHDTNNAAQPTAVTAPPRFDERRQRRRFDCREVVLIVVRRHVDLPPLT